MEALWPGQGLTSGSNQEGFSHEPSAVMPPCPAPSKGGHGPLGGTQGLVPMVELHFYVHLKL